jgi:hypothetical protein
MTPREIENAVKENMTAITLQNMLSVAAKQGAIIALQENGMLPKRIRQSRAYKMYGRKSVQKWEQAGIVKPLKDGVGYSTWYDRAELALAQDFYARISGNQHQQRSVKSQQNNTKNK